MTQIADENDKLSCNLLAERQRGIKIISDENDKVKIFVQTDFQKEVICNNLNQPNITFAVDSTSFRCQPIAKQFTTKAYNHES